MKNIWINIIYKAYRNYMHIYDVCLKLNQTSSFLMETDCSLGQSGINFASENLRPCPRRAIFFWLSWAVQ